jgi:RNA polymerase sigma factor for flagellar operon FliA
MVGQQRSDRDERARPPDETQVLRKYGHLVERLAAQLARRVGSPDLQDDLRSVGSLGLLDAARRFDAGRGVKFETFAQHRIRGAMLDELRQIDHLPRRLRAASDKIAEARRKLSSSLGREPSADEIATFLRIGVSQVVELETLSKPVVALEPLEMETAEQYAMSEELSPMEAAMRRERSAQLVAAIDELTERQRQVVALYYVEGLTFREIARILGVSEPRICQIHGDALRRIREQLSARDAA